MNRILKTTGVLIASAWATGEILGRVKLPQVPFVHTLTTLGLVYGATQTSGMIRTGLSGMAAATARDSLGEISMAAQSFGKSGGNVTGNLVPQGRLATSAKLYGAR